MIQISHDIGDARRWLMALGVIVAALIPTPGLANPLATGVACLEARQHGAGVPAPGSWGNVAASGFRDTTVVADALVLASEFGPALTAAQSFLETAALPNQDYAARRLSTLASLGTPPPGSIDELLAGQSAEITNPAVAGYPGRGWGVAPEFGGDPLTTALAMRALLQARISKGTTVVRAVAPATGQNSHLVTLGTGATNLRILVRGVTGSIRLFIDTPSSGTFSVNLTNVTNPTNLTGLPVETGTYTLRVATLSGGGNVYSLEARFADAGGFDTARMTAALSYLGFAQNADGSWGFRPGDAGSLVATSEVVSTLAAFGNAFAPRKILDDAVVWLKARQHGDGGMGSDAATSTAYETALAALAISAVSPAAPELAAAKTYLLAQQQANGCWNDDDYATGIALQFLAPVFVCRLDVDANGIAEVPTDVVYVARHLLGLPPVPEAFRSADPAIPPDADIAARVTAAGNRFDVDGNGTVDVATDVVYIARRSLGLPPVPASFRTLDPTIPPDAQLIATIDALCVP